MMLFLILSEEDLQKQIRMFAFLFCFLIPTNKRSSYAIIECLQITIMQNGIIFGNTVYIMMYL